MKEGVVEVGPGSVRGPCQAAESLVSAALECIDDEIAMLDEQPVAVTMLWRQVFRTVLSDRVGTAVLVCPTWWPQPRIDRVQEAAAARSSKVIVLQRADVLAGDAPGVPAVVEIAPDFVVISRAGSVLKAEPRVGGTADIARSVADRVGSASAALVDAPVGVGGAVELARGICKRLRAGGITATTVHPDRVLAGTRRPWWGHAERRERPQWKEHRMATSAALVASVTALCTGLVFASERDGSEGTSVPMTLLVEGRVAVKVPALWAVRRITSGPGSARVQVSAPNNSTAVLVTQSQVRKGESLSATSAMLRGALDDQQPGVFSRFNADDRRAERSVATYRELREGRQIDWAVLVDGAVRIGVGCQSTPGGEDAVRHVCEEAIRSAHAIV